MIRSIPHAVLLFVVLMSPAARADNWPQFRGPASNAVANDDFPMTWDAKSNVRWKAETSGEGWSAPVVWDKRIFLTAAVQTKAPPKREQAPANQPRRQRGDRGGGGYDNSPANAEYRWEVRCLDAATGDVLWTQVTREGKPPQGRHQENTFATETPVTDGQRVCAYFGMNGLFCFDMDGNPLWQKDLGNYEMRNQWGTASSPVLHDGMVYLQIDSQEQSFLVALDAATGDQVWRVDRDEPSQYSTPVIWKNSKRTEIVTSARRARSYDPKTGRLLWELDLKGGRSSATPLPVGDRLYIGSESRNRGGDDDGGGYLFAVNAGAEGTIAVDSDKIAWALEDAGIQMASPVLCKGHLYLFERRAGIIHCIDADTGKMVYEQRVPGARAFWSSPWVHGDNVFCLDDDGTTHVIQGGPEFKVVRTNKLEEQVWSSPAIADGALYIRTAKALFCISEGT